MSEPVDLLHNSGWAPRASIVWNGFEPRTIWPFASAVRDTNRPRWHILRFDFDRPAAVEPGRPGELLGLTAADPAAAVLQLLGVAGGEQPGATLAGLIDERIRQLQLPAVIPVEPRIDAPDLRRPVEPVADLLTVVALQARTAGRLLVRDGETRLSRVEHRVAAPTPDGVTRYQWPLRLHLAPDLVHRLRHFRPAVKGWLFK